MKFSFKFSNLLGTIYHKGNLLFTPDGNCIISPVGNRITIYDLRNLFKPLDCYVIYAFINSNKTSTLPIESRFNFTALDMTPDGCMLAAVNEQGDAHLISMISRTTIYKYRFKGKVRCIRFSPDGKHFAACKENSVFVFKTPGLSTGEFNAFVMERVFHEAYDETTCLDWSSDSSVLAVGSKDCTTKLYSFEKCRNFRVATLGSHNDALRGVFFEKDSLDVITISRNGHLCLWESNIDLTDLAKWEPPEKRIRKDSGSEDDAPKEKEKEKDDEEGIEEDDVAEINVAEGKEKPKRLHYKRLGKHYLNDLVKTDRACSLTSAAYHKESRVFVTGFSNGSFYLHEMPSVIIIHSLSISDQLISSIALNPTGDWVALGCAGLGQLLVWEWQSETYVLKQQGHANNMTCLAYSSDGQYIVTGGDDGKVKLWNTTTGFCFVTFTEHTGCVRGVQFSANRKFVVSSSLDGTVRAFDLTRYRNFRTFTSPTPVQFTCVALDHSGEFVAAGGQDVFEIYIWSVKIGRLLEVLAGHEGPVSSVTFCPSPTSTALASASWDRTVRLWNAIESGSDHETLDLTSDVLSVAYRPDGAEVAVATLDGQISFFSVPDSQQTGSIEGRNDLGSGRSDTDLVTAKQTLKAKAFTTICYSADGRNMIAAGQSKNVCIYNVKEQMPVKKFVITQNRSLDAVDDFVNRRNLTEFGNLALVEQREELEGGKVNLKLPGVRSGDLGARNFKPEVRVYSLQFSPTGQAWAAVTTEGLLVYSLDVGLVFDPFMLELGITPESVRKTLSEKENARALMMALKLNEKDLLREVFEAIPVEAAELCVESLPEAYRNRALRQVTVGLEESRHLDFYLRWCTALMNRIGAGRVVSRGPVDTDLTPTLIAIQKCLTQKFEQIGKVCDFNKYTLQFLKRKGELIARRPKVNGTENIGVMEVDTVNDGSAERESADEDEFMG